MSSCFLNDRGKYAWPDWTWLNAANIFFDAEIGGLVCPRALYVEVGAKDEIFTVGSAGPVARTLAGYYERLGLAERFRYKEFEGMHELDKADESIDFLETHVR